MKHTALFLVLLYTTAALATADPLPATRLRTQLMASVVLAPGEMPRFSWTAVHSENGQAQTEAHVQVRTSDGRESALVWESAPLETAFARAVYAGPALKPAAAYVWRVRWADRERKWAPWSTEASFRVGPAPDQWNASQWIGGSQTMLRREFNVPAALPNATVYVSGLGFFQLFGALCECNACALLRF